MRRFGSSLVSLSVVMAMAACGSGTSSSNTPTPDASNPGKGGSVATGGTSQATGGTQTTGTGGTVSTQGGNTPATGGSAGKATGGTSTNPTGGVSAPTGGTSTTGGSAGASTGGVNTTGGSAGAATGGILGTGGSAGAATGGAGGKDAGVTGGATSTGGVSSPDAGSTATGGSSVPDSVLVTSASGAYWKTGTFTEVTSAATFTVTETTAYQTWEGFGGAFNEKGWDFLGKLPTADRDRAISLLYGSDGLRLNFGRIPIGASDYAIERYTLDEVASGSKDTSMTSFSLTRDEQYLIPYIKAAQAVNPKIRFWGSPWTPPTWMKVGPFSPNTGKASRTPYDGGNMSSDDATLKAFAQYFIKFVQEYEKKGISVEAVAPQNEPTYQQNYPTCQWAPALFAKFIGQYMGPAFEAANLSAKIMLGTMSNGSGDPAVVTAVMGDAAAKKYVKVFGYQWAMQSRVSADLASYGIPIWQSEHECGNFPSGSNNVAPNDHAYAVQSWGLLMNWIKAGVVVYNAWNMILDKVGMNNDIDRPWAQNSLLVVDTSAKTLTQTPYFHVFRHISYFVEPGAKRVAISGSNSLAFKNPDGSLVAILYNSGAAGNQTVAIGGKKLQFQMPNNGWATIKIKP